MLPYPSHKQNCSCQGTADQGQLHGLATCIVTQSTELHFILWCYHPEAHTFGQGPECSVCSVYVAHSVVDHVVKAHDQSSAFILLDLAAARSKVSHSLCHTCFPWFPWCLTLLVFLPHRPSVLSFCCSCLLISPNSNIGSLFFSISALPRLSQPASWF